jgi:TRAP transporter TAXI family solute receptor
MKKKILIISNFCLVLVLAALPFFSACGETTPETYEIEIYGGKAGMSPYVNAIALAEFINENSTWLRATPIETPNLTASFNLLMYEPERRANTLIMTVHQFHLLASEGKEPFTTQYDGLRFISTTGYTALGFITLDPDIKTVDDFVGKRVSIGDLSSVTMVALFNAIFESAGVLDEVELEHLGLSEGINALRDGLIDATWVVVFLSGPGQYAINPAMSEIVVTKDVYFASIDSEDIVYMIDLLGPLNVEHTVPAGSLGETQTEPWVTLGAASGWAADKEMPDDVVYEICRIIYENADIFQEYDRSLAVISQETMAYWDVPEADMHPGALQLFEDYGVDLGSY